MKIKNLRPIASTGRDDDSFVGLKIDGNEVLFYYPITYRFDPESDDARNDIVALLKTISLAKTKTALRANVNSVRENETDFALGSYLWMISDYVSNGFYFNRETIFKTNQSGKVDWKRTMKSNPIISDGNVIYNDLVVRTKSDVENLLAKIYKFCLKKSIDYIGWMFNMTSSFIETMPFNDAIKKSYVAAVDKELSSTFGDVKRVRLTHMKNVLLGLDTAIEGKVFTYGVDKYHGVYEKMIDSIFGTVIDKADFNPAGKWQLVKNSFKETTASSELKPDTILIKDKKVYVIDAKFYRFGHSGLESDLPETSSIQKQITYGDFVKTNVIDGAKEVYNAFIIPYDMYYEGNAKIGFQSGQVIQYVGYAKSTWKDNSSDHEIIHTFLIDLKHVVKEWCKRNHNDDVDSLIAEIEKRNAEAKAHL